MTQQHQGKSTRILYETDKFISQGNYAAVSYTWEACRFEEGRADAYHIVCMGSQRLEPAEVRDIILNRVVKFINYFGLPAFWIDGECINQKDDKGKEPAIQSMDMIYRRSGYPIGMLSTLIRRQREINLLVRLMHGEFVNDHDSSQPPQLAFKIGFWKV